MKIIAAQINLSKIDKSRIVAGANGAKYYDFSIILNDALDKFGKDVAITAGQTKEERDTKIPRVYIGNGKTVFTKEPDGASSQHHTGHNNQPASNASDDLPF